MQVFTLERLIPTMLFSVIFPYITPAPFRTASPYTHFRRIANPAGRGMGYYITTFTLFSPMRTMAVSPFFSVVAREVVVPSALAADSLRPDRS